MKKILITGTLGFIFSNFIRKAMKDNPNFEFVGVDKAVKSYNLDNMHSDSFYNFYLADIADAPDQHHHAGVVYARYQRFTVLVRRDHR